MHQINRVMLVEALFAVIAAMVYIYPLKKKEPTEIRWVASFVAAIIIVLSMEIWIPFYPIIQIGKQLIYLVVLYFAIWQCTDMRKVACWYVAIWSLISSQFLLALWYLIGYFVPYLVEQTKFGILLIILYYAYFMWMIALTLAVKMPNKDRYEIGPRQLVSAVMFMILFQILVYMQFHFFVERLNIYYYIGLVLSQFYCISMLFVQTELFKKSALEKELLTMNLLLKQQSDQYHLTRENIDLINRKCHDLKHQIRAIRNMENDEKKEAYIEELEQSVQIYESIVKTGNEVLDTILTDKSLYCEAHGIKINCIVDGSQLRFIETVDLYAVLGNAIDNAIECVSEFREKAKRLIDIRIYSKGEFLIMEISNPFEGNLKFKNGLPVSTKKNAGYHGYGLKSIKHTVKQYNGFLNVDTSNQRFSLKMLIPLPKVPLS